MKVNGASAGGEILDDDAGYGPVGARTLDKTKALHNADNYAYFASVNDVEMPSAASYVADGDTGSLFHREVQQELRRRAPWD